SRPPPAPIAIELAGGSAGVPPTAGLPPPEGGASRGAGPGGVSGGPVGPAPQIGLGSIPPPSSATPGRHPSGTHAAPLPGGAVAAAGTSPDSAPPPPKPPVAPEKIAKIAAAALGGLLVVGLLARCALRP